MAHQTIIRAQETAQNMFGSSWTSYIGYKPNGAEHYVRSKIRGISSDRLRKDFMDALSLALTKELREHKKVCTTPNCNKDGFYDEAMYAIEDEYEVLMSRNGSLGNTQRILDAIRDTERQILRGIEEEGAHATNVALQLVEAVTDVSEAPLRQEQGLFVRLGRALIKSVGDKAVDTIVDSSLDQLTDQFEKTL